MKRNIKCITCSAVAVAIATSIMAGCGAASESSSAGASVSSSADDTKMSAKETGTSADTGKSDSDGITIQFWHTRGSGANLEVVQHAVKEFNDTIGKEKGITVEETFIGGYDDMYSKTQLAVQSGEQPQVVVEANTYVPYLIEDGVFADMAPLAEETGFDKSNILDPFLQIYGNTDGTLYSLPYIRSTPIFYYNKTMADAAGITLPQELTIDEMEKFCKAMYKKDESSGETTVYGLEIPNDFGYMQAANLYQLGSAMLSDDGKSFPALEDGALLKVLGDWRKWVDEGWCLPFESTDSAADNLKTMFCQGKLASFISSTGSLTNMIQASKDAGFELGVSFYPTYDASKATAEIGGGNIGVIAQGNSDEQIKASWEFVQFLMSDEQVAYSSINSGYLPVTKSVVDYDEMKDFWNSNPLYKVGYDQLCKNGRCQELPYSPNLQDIIQVCWDASSMLIQDQSIDASEAVEQIKTNTAQYFE